VTKTISDAWAYDIGRRFISPYTLTIFLNKNCLNDLGFDYKINLNKIERVKVMLADIWGNATITFTFSGKWGPQSRDYNIGKEQFITILKHAMGCSKCSIKAVGTDITSWGLVQECGEEELEDLIIYLEKIADKIEPEFEL